MTRLSLRIDFDGPARLGPGKVRLLELVEAEGSIAAAARAMGMSYRRAWLLIDSLNRTFVEPLVVRQTGGTRGGGAALTPFGRSVVARFRTIERLAAEAAGDELAALAAALSPDAVADMPPDDRS